MRKMIWELVLMAAETEGGAAVSEVPVEGVETPAGEAAPPVAPAPPKDAWAHDRISKLTARLRAAEAERDALKANPTAIPSQQPVAQPPVSQEVLSELARKQAETKQFNDDCENIARAGYAAFGQANFSARISDLTSLVDYSSPASVENYNEFLKAVIDTGQGPTILYQLGEDKNVAYRLLSMSPAKMGMELARLAAGVVAKAEDGISKAPKPIVPLTNKGPSNTRIDPSDPERGAKMDKESWFVAREAQVKEKFGKRGLR